MKFAKTTIALGAMMLALSSAAADFGVDRFPALRPAQQETHNRQMRAPLNQEKKKGMKIFGTTVMDSYHRRAFVNIYSGATYPLERLETVLDQHEADSSPDSYLVLAGAVDGKGDYYGYKVMSFFIGGIYTYQWIKADPETGEWDVYKELDRHAAVEDYYYGMAWNGADNKMYVLSQATDGTITSRLGVIDLATMNVSSWHALPEYYFAVAFNLDGEMYGIRWKYEDPGNGEPVITGTRLDVFDKSLNLLSSTDVLVDGNPYKSYYQHGLVVDDATGDLWWTAGDSEGYQSLVKINPDDCSTVNYGRVGLNETMHGLYIKPRKAESRQAPALVNDLTFEICSDGSDQVTLKWTNPSTQWNRKPLSGLQSVLVFRDGLDGEPVATLDATGKEGQAMEYTDRTAGGKHTYYVVAANAAGRGVAESIEAFVGHDVPGPVTNLSVSSSDGKSVTVRWRAPKTGDSEGWFDTNLTYEIRRYPGNTLVASGIAEGGGNNRYTDSDIPECQYYTYEVTAINADGRGTPTMSDGIIAGQSVVIPFYTDFPTRIEAARFKSFDSMGTEGCFTYDFNTNNPGENRRSSMKYMFNKTGNDAVFCTPPLAVKKGHTYRVDYTYSYGRYGHSFEDNVFHHFRIIGGYGASVPEMSQTIQDLDNYQIRPSHFDGHITTYFEAPEDGDYYVGFHVLTSNLEFDSWMFIEDFRIVETDAHELKVESYDCNEQISNKSDNPFIIQIANNGVNDESDYTLEAGILDLNGNFRPFAAAAAENKPVLKAREMATVTFRGYPEDVSGYQQIAFRVTLPDKEGEISEPVTVNISDIDGLIQNTLGDDEIALDTGLPMFHQQPYSLTQSLYRSAVTAFKGDWPTITTLGWRYNAEYDVTGTKIKVYLNQADNEFYTEGAKAVDMLPAGEVVYEGTIDFNEGENHMAAIKLDKEFSYDPRKSLVITIEKEDLENVGEFPILFHSTRHNAEEYPSMRYAGTGPGTMENYLSLRMYSYPELPVLYMGGRNFDVIGAVEGIGADNQGTIAVKDGNALFSGFKAMRLIDLSGRVLLSRSLEASESVELGVQPGVYILEGITSDNSRQTLRIFVK